MTSNYHDPHIFGDPLDSSVLNDPLGDLDAALSIAIASGFVGASTTTDASSASGQKVVPVTATTGFAVGDPVWIGFPGSGLVEMGTVNTIQAGVSLTMLVNLTNTHASGTPVSRSPIELVQARGTFSTLGDRVDQTETRFFDVRRYGAVLDGVTGDTSAVQAAIDAAGVAGGTVWIPGPAFITTVNILSANVVLTGPGSIVSGTVRIGRTSGTDGVYDELRTQIIGIRFTRATQSDTVNAIEIGRANNIRVTDCRFDNYNAGVAVPATNIGAANNSHVGKVQIRGCQGDNTNHLLLVERPTVFDTWAAADFHVEDCSLICLKANILAECMDGLVVEGNTFFMPGFWDVARRGEKTENIYIDEGHWIVIANNNLFEAGTSSIRLNMVQNFTIGGNNIAWPGQRIPSHGIYVTGGDTGGAEFNLGTISGNSIMFPTFHGIGIEAPSGHITIFGNIVRSAGHDVVYYGVIDLATLEHWGIYTELGVEAVLVFGNHAAANENALVVGTGYGALNYDVDTNLVTTYRTLLVVTPETSLSVKGIDTFHLASVSSHTITALNDGFAGQQIMFVADNGNTTVQHNTDIRLRLATNYALGTNMTLTLRFSNGFWYEVARQ